SRPRQNLAGPENDVGCRWHREDRADAPDERAGMHGCEEKLLSGVANSVRAAVEERIWLTHHRDDRARNDSPLRIQMQWDNRLNIENVLRPSEWTIVEGGIVLKWNADQVRYRILRCRGQVLARVLFRFCAARGSLVNQTTLEFVIDTELDHLNVTAKACQCNRGRGPALQREIIVLDFDGPMGLEAIFEAGTPQEARSGSGTIPA